MKRFVLPIIILLISLTETVFGFEEFKPINVGILVYDEVYLLDFAGPYEVFFDTFINDTTRGFRISLIAVKELKIKAHTGTIIKADYTIDNAPEIDLLIVPGGNLKLAAQSEKTANFIKDRSNLNCTIMSVCTGAFILADLGLLNYMKATTWYGAKQMLKQKYPLIIISDDRLTDNGKILTTAGVSAGIDGAFYLVEKYYGKEIADRTRKYIEWDK